MLDLVAQYPLLDIVIYGLLLFAFHWCVFRSPIGCAVIALMALGKMAHTCGVNTDGFWLSINLAAFGGLWVGLFLTRFSPNYFWLFTGLLAVKFVDVSLHPWLRLQGGWYFLWLIAADVLVLVLLDQRSKVVNWVAQFGYAEARKWAQAAQPYQRLAYQDVLLMALYWVSIILSLITLIEFWMYNHSPWQPSFFYDIYSYIKLPLNLFELVILFNIATGHAISFEGRKRVW